MIPFNHQYALTIKQFGLLLPDSFLRRLKTEVAITRLAYLIWDVDSEIEELEKK